MKKLEIYDYNVKFPNNILTSPLGMLRSIVVKLEDLAFHIDFVILKGFTNDEELLIFGKSFTKTSEVILHMEKGILTLTNGKKTFEQQM